MSEKLTPEVVAEALQESLSALAAVEDAATLRGQKAQIVGENSPISRLNALIKAVPNEQKAEAGKLVGGARAKLNQAFEEKEVKLESLAANEALANEKVDMTAAPKFLKLGARHPLSLLMDQVSDVFVGMGWEIADGPELENEWFNFDALNFHPDHPARAMQDTFFVKPVENHLLLRTHTSPVQVRSLLER